MGKHGSRPKQVKRAPFRPLKNIDRLMSSVYKSVHEVSRNSSRDGVMKQRSDQLERLGVPRQKKAVTLLQHRENLKSLREGVHTQREQDIATTRQTDAARLLRKHKMAKEERWKKQMINIDKNVGDVSSNFVQFGNYSKKLAGVRVSTEQYRAMFGIKDKVEAPEEKKASRPLWRNKGKKKRQQKKKNRHCKM